MDDTPQLVTRTKGVDLYDGLSLGRAIEVLKELHQEFPEASLVIDYGEDYFDVSVAFKRLETLQEVKDRLTQKAHQEAYERSQYERLKAKFG